MTRFSRNGFNRDAQHQAFEPSMLRQSQLHPVGHGDNKILVTLLQLEAQCPFPICLFAALIQAEFWRIN